MKYSIAPREITYIQPRAIPQASSIQHQPYEPAPMVQSSHPEIPPGYALVHVSQLQHPLPPEKDPTELPKRICFIAGGALGAICFVLLLSAIQGNQQPVPMASPAPTPAPPQIIVVPQQQPQPQERSRCIIFCAN